MVKFKFGKKKTCTHFKSKTRCAVFGKTFGLVNFLFSPSVIKRKHGKKGTTNKRYLI